MTHLTTYQTAVLPEWVDYNQHLRDAFYLLIFSYATDSLMDHLGLDEAGRTRTGHTLYTLECHLNYLNEVRVGVQVEVRTQLIAHDQKRLHINHSLHLVGVETSLAESEQMLMNVDVNSGRSALFDDAVGAEVKALARSQQGLPTPQYAGRVIGLPKR